MSDRRSCHWCAGPLRPRQRKFCCETCRRRWTNSFANPWHLNLSKKIGRRTKVDQLP